MDVFLIQASGRPIQEDAHPAYRQQAAGPTFVDEPLRHGRYVNAAPFWRREGYGRRAAWERVGAGDLAMLYCTSSVDRHPRCLSHLLPVEGRTIDEDGAVLDLGTAIELAPKVPYEDLQGLVEAGELSERMGLCGQQGFNFTRVERSDLDAVQSYVVDE